MSFITNKQKPRRQWLWFGALYLGSLVVIGFFMGLLHGILAVLMHV